MADQFLMESRLSVIDEEDIQVGYAYLECILLFHTKIIQLNMTLNQSVRNRFILKLLKTNEGN